MKALTWHGKGDMRCEDVPDPKIEDGRDAIIKVTACAICGSDLHIYDGVIPSMEHGDIVGHEPWAKWSKSARRTASSRSATAFTFLSPSHAENAFSAVADFSPAASARTPTRTRLPSYGAARPPASSATRICSAATRADRQNICVFPMLTSDRSRYLKDRPTSRCYSFRISSPPLFLANAMKILVTTA